MIIAPRLHSSSLAGSLRASPSEVWTPSVILRCRANAIDPLKGLAGLIHVEDGRTQQRQPPQGRGPGRDRLLHLSESRMNRIKAVEKLQLAMAWEVNHGAILCIHDMGSCPRRHRPLFLYRSVLFGKVALLSSSSRRTLQ